MELDSKDDNQDLQKYILVRSSSTVFSSASNKLSRWVSIKMDSGWSPHGPPQFIFESESFHLIQAMVKL